MRIFTHWIALVIVAILPHHRPHHHHKPTSPKMETALASWYVDSGETASGRHYPLGFASLILGDQWGKRVLFCYGRRCAIGNLDDHGPYISGRTFDLNPALKATLGCPDLCVLRWRIA